MDGEQGQGLDQGHIGTWAAGLGHRVWSGDGNTCLLGLFMFHLMWVTLSCTLFGWWDLGLWASHLLTSLVSLSEGC